MTQNPVDLFIFYLMVFDIFKHVTNVVSSAIIQIILVSVCTFEHSNAESWLSLDVTNLVFGTVAKQN